METSRDHVSDHVSGHAPETPGAEKHIRTRCPSCQKLYLIDPLSPSALAAFEKQGERPLFECTACLSQFALRLPLNPSALEAASDLVGVSGKDLKSDSGPQSTSQPVPQAAFQSAQTTSQQMSQQMSPQSGQQANVQSNLQTEVRPAPSALVVAPTVSVSGTESVERSVTRSATLSIESAESATPAAADSGKVDAEAEQIAAEMALGAKPELILLWKDIIENYEIEAKHDTFIHACAKAGSLPYAAHRYGRILAEFPDEEIARKMRLRLVQVATAPMEMARVEKPVETPSSRPWSLNSIIIMLGTAVTLIGASMPSLKNMTKIGIAMMALAFGIRFFSRR